MKKVIVVCFALAMVMEAGTAQAQLFGGRFRIRQNRNNCCCQPTCGTETGAVAATETGEVVVSASSYEGGEVAYQSAPVMSEVAPVSYAEPVSSDCGCTGSVGQVSYEAPMEPTPMQAMPIQEGTIQPMTIAPSTDCGGCCSGCGEVSPVAYEGAYDAGVVQPATYQDGVIYQGQPTLATQGETIVSEEVISEESVTAETTIESPASEASTPTTAPASEDSVPDAPKSGE